MDAVDTALHPGRALVQQQRLRRFHLSGKPDTTLDEHLALQKDYKL